jgi:hypothetical protein
MAEHVVLELDRDVVERAEGFMNCSELRVENIQWHLVVLPQAVAAVVGQLAAQAAGAMK